MKKNKILKFAKFPQCKLELTEVEKDREGKYRPFRWEIIKNNHSDFDLYIDDSTRGISSTRKAFSHNKDKIYAFPDYKCSRHLEGSSIYHVRTKVSDLKDIDFALGALEYRTKKIEQEIQEFKISSKESKPNSFTFWLVPLAGVICLELVLILAANIRKKRK